MNEKTALPKPEEFEELQWHVDQYLKDISDLSIHSDELITDQDQRLYYLRKVIMYDSSSVFFYSQYIDRQTLERDRMNYVIVPLRQVLEVAEVLRK